MKCLVAFWLRLPGLPNEMDSSLKVVVIALPPALSQQVERVTRQAQDLRSGTGSTTQEPRLSAEPVAPSMK